MTDQEIKFASQVLVAAMCFLVAYTLIWWPEIGKNGRLFLCIGSFVMLIVWSLL